MSRRIMVIAGLGVAICAYYIFIEDRPDLIYLLAASLLILVISYVFQYQIDQLAIRGVPQKLNAAMYSFLVNTAPQFSSMDEDRRRMVEDRMKRWLMKKEFISKQEHDVPEDVKYLIAYYAVLLTIHQQDYVYKGLDRVAFYQHPFLSPTYPDDVHIVEVEPEDGTIIFSFPHVLKGHFEKGYYNVALHGMADAYKRLYIQEEISWPDDIWDQLESISHISRDRLEAYIGLPLSDPWPVAVHHQFTYRGTQIPEVLRILPQGVV